MGGDKEGLYPSAPDSIGAPTPPSVSLLPKGPPPQPLSREWRPTPPLSPHHGLRLGEHLSPTAQRPASAPISPRPQRGGNRTHQRPGVCSCSGPLLGPNWGPGCCGVSQEGLARQQGPSMSTGHWWSCSPAVPTQRPVQPEVRVSQPPPPPYRQGQPGAAECAQTRAQTHAHRQTTPRCTRITLS